METTHLIFNPVAGSQDPDHELGIIRSILSAQLDNLIVWQTTPSQSADDLARKALSAGTSRIIVAGGDGTLSAVAGTMIGSTVPLGLIPQGTVNAFASALGIPHDIESACEVILQGGIRHVDTAWCNGQCMILLLGIGIEANTIAQTSSQAKRRWGASAYLPAMLQQLRTMDPFDVIVEVNGHSFEMSALAFTVANAVAGVSILAQGSDEVSPHDGLLDVTVVSSQTIPEALSATYTLVKSMLSNCYADHPAITTFRASHLKVRTDPPQPVVIDGELTDRAEIEIRCIPKSLNLMVPEGEVGPSTEDPQSLSQLQVQLM